jgi:hypothetical protein
MENIVEKGKGKYCDGQYEGRRPDQVPAQGFQMLKK